MSADQNLSQFYLFGHPISHSLSPLLHNTGFKIHNLNKKYSLCDTTDISNVVQVLKQSDTCGGSVTIPHKQAIMRHIDILSDAAKSIDAVNTVWKVRSWETIQYKRRKSFFPSLNFQRKNHKMNYGQKVALYLFCTILNVLIPIFLENRTRREKFMATTQIGRLFSI